ncbi:hypothetical protein HK100_012704 [Physocladia obscura]|uniref:Periplasmic binding protein-like II n=1 Tax=Physocladia obscura TaxID=109957 RepID=A0AAD5SZF2_9FUNG|nr:hypothetical protein HK100_012704 [Physocladia obscura]
MTNDQATSSYGEYISKSIKLLESSTENNNSYLKIDVKQFPVGQDYNVYLSQVRSACNQKIGALFDVVMLEATVLGDLADCLVDLSKWDQYITNGFSAGFLTNSYVNGRLVSLPTEADLGVIYFNAEVLARYSSQGPPYSFDDIESMATAVLTALRAVDNYGFSGYTAQFAGEYLTAQVAEWLRGYNNSAIIDPTTGYVAIETNSVAEVIQRISEWTTTNIIDPNDFLNPAVSTYQTSSGIAAAMTNDPSVVRFAAGNSLFLRHWASTYPILLSALSFDWGVGPVVGWDSHMNVGAVGGWGFGVYKYSTNPTAAVKVVNWLASKGMQRSAVVRDGLNIIPTRQDLYSDSAVCTHIGQDLCDIFRNATPALRPSSLVGHHYNNVSNIISSQMATFFMTSETIVDAITNLAAELLIELNQTRVSNTISVDPSAVGKKIPTHMQAQLMGLAGVILITCVTVYMLKRRQIDDGIKDASEKIKTLAQAAKQEVIMKTQRRADLDFGANEFAHLDEEIDSDDKVAPLSQKGGKSGRGYSIVGAEKDDFI